MPNIVLGRWVIAGVIASLVGVGGIFLTPLFLQPSADMRIEPTSGAVVVGDAFTITIVTESSIPVNVFAGEVEFDADILYVDSIDYNTSVADLWAERPWFQNGEGTLNFAGGTTRPGGFVGTENLLSITFKSKAAGDAAISLSGARILQHDGFGTDVTLATPIDALFAVSDDELESETVLKKTTSSGPTIRVMPERPNTDLNDDGTTSILDMSIFMSRLASQNLRSDFNDDGKVNTKDLSIIMKAE